MTSFKIVAAIDIGTPFSTYAYSTTEGFKKDPLDVHQKRTWYSDSRRKGITKTATCLLLDKNQRFVSFGNDAQQQFADFKRLRKSNEYLFFRNFNLQLYESKVGSNLALFLKMLQINLKDMFMTAKMYRSFTYCLFHSDYDYNTKSTDAPLFLTFVLIMSVCYGHTLLLWNLSDRFS